MVLEIVQCVSELSRSLPFQILKYLNNAANEHAMLLECTLPFTEVHCDSFKISRIVS